jgi:chromosome segregation ATPase
MPSKRAKTTTTTAGENGSFQSRFYNRLIQGTTSMAELKGTAYEIKGFLTGRLEMVQQKSAERKYLLAQSENKIVDARVNKELMRVQLDKSRLQLDESRYHEEHLREEIGRLREVITMLRRH